MKKYVDIDYVGNGNKSQALDLWLPDSDEFPVFVYFHGGGIENGKRTDFDHVADILVGQGIAVVSADYRMYPEAKYPDFIDDAASAVAWVKNNIGNYGRCTGIYVGGSSAGGYISMMLCFDKKYLENVGVSPSDISGYVHDAGQPTAHFNVLRERGIDSRRVIVDESAPLYHIGTSPEYPPMQFIISDDDMKNRYEQTMLVISTLKHFGYDMSKVYLKEMHGKHCHYCNKSFDGGAAFATIISEFMSK